MIEVKTGRGRERTTITRSQDRGVKAVILIALVLAFWFGFWVAWHWSTGGW